MDSKPTVASMLGATTFATRMGRMATPGTTDIRSHTPPHITSYSHAAGGTASHSAAQALPDRPPTPVIGLATRTLHGTHFARRLPPVSPPVRVESSSGVGTSRGSQETFPALSSI